MTTVLHTSDWHLGQRFFHYDRTHEHARFLRWLLDTIERERVDILIIAGDVFDVGNPPSQALRQYYRFLHQLQQSCCQHTVIVGGNHDFASTLEQPRELLKALNVHVIGATPWRLGESETQLQRAVLPLENAQGDLLAVVAAIPFLRDRDLKQSVSGERLTERADSIRQGIQQHYAAAWAAVQPWQGQAPLLATGHLFAAGVQPSDDSERAIQCGNLGVISAQEFAFGFDYVALGHLHRAQTVGGLEHVRYAGAPIPLGFKESVQAKSVTLVRFDGATLKKIQTLPVPTACFRSMLRFEGNLDTVCQAIAALPPPPPLFSEQVQAWAEIHLQLSQRHGHEEEQVLALATAQGVEVLKLRLSLPQANTHFLPLNIDLDSLTPEQVFLKRCDNAGFSEERQEELLVSFRELCAMVEAQADDNA